MWMFPKIVVRPNHPFSYKPSILGCRYFWKHPCKYTIVPWILRVWFPHPPLTKSLHSWLHWKSVPTDRLAPKTTKSPAGVRSFSNDIWFYAKNQSWLRKSLEIHWISRKIERILLGCLRKLLKKRAHWLKSKKKNSENFKVPEIRTHLPLKPNTNDILMSYHQNLQTIESVSSPQNQISSQARARSHSLSKNGKWSSKTNFSQLYRI